MHVVRCGRAAFRTVINHKIPWQRSREFEHVSEFSFDVLDSVLAMNDREVTIDNRKGIAEKRS